MIALVQSWVFWTVTPLPPHRWLHTIRRSVLLASLKICPLWWVPRLTKNKGKWSLVSTLVSFQVFKMIFLNSFTDGTNTQNICCSSRATKGSGSQIIQLQNIEHIQSEWISSRTSHASQLNAATANEPLNPMAPMWPKPCTKHSAVSVRDADDHLVVGLVGFHYHEFNYWESANAHRSLHPLTGCPCPHIKQLWKVLTMGFILKTQIINVKKMIPILPPPFLYLSSLMGLLLWLFMGGLLPQLLMGVLLPQLLVRVLLLQLLMGGLLPWLLVECPLPQLLVGGLFPRLLVEDLSPLFLILFWLPAEVLWLQVHMWYLIADLFQHPMVCPLIQPLVYWMAHQHIFMNWIQQAPCSKICLSALHLTSLHLIPHHHLTSILMIIKARYQTSGTINAQRPVPTISLLRVHISNKPV